MPKELPKGWKEVASKSRPGKVYFLNLKTGEKTWKLAHVHGGDKEGRHKDDSRERRRSRPDSSTNNGNDSKPDARHDALHAFHILIKHAGSRNPSSWRQETITRTKAVATAKLEGIREKLVAATKDSDSHGREVKVLRQLFEEIAKEESDCRSAKRGGDLGKFGHGKMMPSFEKAAFALRVGELSEIVESDSGVHIILRVA